MSTLGRCRTSLGGVEVGVVVVVDDDGDDEFGLWWFESEFLGRRGGCAPPILAMPDMSVD